MHADLDKMTFKEKATFKSLSEANRRSIFNDLSARANVRSSGDRSLFPDWQMVKRSIAKKYSLHRIHVNSIIREFSGTSSTRRGLLPKPNPYY